MSFHKLQLSRGRIISNAAARCRMSQAERKSAAQQRLGGLRQASIRKSDKNIILYEKYWLHLFEDDIKVAPVDWAPFPLTPEKGARFWQRMTEGHQQAVKNGCKEGPPLMKGPSGRATQWPRLLVRAVQQRQSEGHLHGCLHACPLSLTPNLFSCCCADYSVGERHAFCHEPPVRTGSRPSTRL